jgi:hypothetical protein
MRMTAKRRKAEEAAATAALASGMKRATRSQILATIQTLEANARAAEASGLIKCAARRWEMAGESRERLAARDQEKVA